MALVALEGQGAIVRFGFGPSACYFLSQQLLKVTGTELGSDMLLRMRMGCKLELQNLRQCLVHAYIEPCTNHVSYRAVWSFANFGFHLL